MSKASQIIVLCEDKLQEVVVCQFLKGWKVSLRSIRVIAYPNGKGSGEAHVRTNYPQELKAYRSRHSKTILIVVIDADKDNVEQHHRELELACKNANPAINPRQANEAVVHVIPKYHIETWLAYLDGKNVNENNSYKSGYEFKNKESECHKLVEQLVNNCKKNIPLESPPPSLKDVCDEFKRIKLFLQG